MLTTEGRENRDWVGLTALRQLIGSEKLREYRESFYSHVIIAGADSELDHYGKYRVLGGLVAQNTEQITQALA